MEKINIHKPTIFALTVPTIVTGFKDILQKFAHLFCVNINSS
jgi:hypothetical protein